jgi:large subunit ribosomal protein L32
MDLLLRHLLAVGDVVCKDFLLFVAILSKMTEVDNVFYHTVNFINSILFLEYLIMPVPKRKRSRPRRDSRFANKGLTALSIVRCSTADCGVALMPHQLCKMCGYYRGVQVISGKKARLEVRAQHAQQKEAQEAQRDAQQGAPGSSAQ